MVFEQSAVPAPAPDRDRDLADLLRDSDPGALSAIYDRFGSRAYGVALRIVADPGLAQDAVQDAFLAVWHQRESYRAERGRFGSWVLAIAHHRAVDLTRRRNREIATGDVNSAFLRSPDAADEALARIEASDVRDALTRIPPLQREALLLAYFGGLTQVELAAAVGVPLGTAKSRVRLGLLALREAFEQVNARAENPDVARHGGGPQPLAAHVR